MMVFTLVAKLRKPFARMMWDYYGLAVPDVCADADFATPERKYWIETMFYPKVFGSRQTVYSAIEKIARSLGVYMGAADNAGRSRALRRRGGLVLLVNSRTLTLPPPDLRWTSGLPPFFVVAVPAAAVDPPYNITVLPVFRGFQLVATINIVEPGHAIAHVKCKQDSPAWFTFDNEASRRGHNMIRQKGPKLTISSRVEIYLIYVVN